MPIYLDNAATSWPKPEPVYAAVDRCQREVGASAGRGAYRAAVEAQRIVDSARRGCAQMLGAPDPSAVVLGFNATDMLNLAILGLVRRGERIVTTVAEHNSVLRPTALLAEKLGVEVVRVACRSDGVVDLDAWRAAFNRPTRLAAFLHASNVTGAVQPAADMAVIAQAAGARVLLDAAQTLGHRPLNVLGMPIDLLAASGHKGLLGPSGTGLLWIGPNVADELEPIRVGGTGLDSDAEIAPAESPQRFEAGSHNVTALAGLAAACQWHLNNGGASVANHESAFVRRLAEGLQAINGVTVVGPAPDADRAAVVSFTVAGYDPQEFAALLDAVHGVQCRAGLHCAPLMHKALGTYATGGTVRMSVGWSTTSGDVDAAIAAVADLVGACV